MSCNRCEEQLCDHPCFIVRFYKFRHQEHFIRWSIHWGTCELGVTLRSVITQFDSSSRNQYVRFTSLDLRWTKKLMPPWDNVRHLSKRINPNIMFVTRIYDTSPVGSLVSLFREMIITKLFLTNLLILIRTIKGWLLESIRIFLWAKFMDHCNPTFIQDPVSHELQSDPMDY